MFSSRWRTADSYESREMVNVMERKCSSYTKANGSKESFPCFTHDKPTATGAYIAKHVDRSGKPTKYVGKYIYSDNHGSSFEPFLECVPIKGPVERWSCKVDTVHWKKLED